MIRTRLLVWSSACCATIRLFIVAAGLEMKTEEEQCLPDADRRDSIHTAWLGWLLIAAESVVHRRA